MITVSDIEHIKGELLDIFPEAIRGSVSKSKWGKGRKMLHLAYFILSDSVAGYLVHGRGGLYYFHEWSTGGGDEYVFAESDIDKFIERIRQEYGAKGHGIDRCVNLNSINPMAPI